MRKSSLGRGRSVIEVGDRSRAREQASRGRGVERSLTVAVRLLAYEDQADVHYVRVRGTRFPQVPHPFEVVVEIVRVEKAARLGIAPGVFPTRNRPRRIGGAVAAVRTCA